MNMKWVDIAYGIWDHDVCVREPTTGVQIYDGKWWVFLDTNLAMSRLILDIHGYTEKDFLQLPMNWICA